MIITQDDMKRTKTYASLKAWRTDARLTQREAARLLAVPQALYARIELGQTTRPVRAKAISDRTGVPFEILMGVA